MRYYALFSVAVGVHLRSIPILDGHLNLDPVLDDSPSLEFHDTSAGQNAPIERLEWDSRCSIVQVNQVIFTVQKEGQTAHKSSRHADENRRLLQRMSKTHGVWDVSHPRHRLLDALYGYSQYLQSHRAELDRLKRLYGHVPQKQKTVLENVVQYSKKFTDIDHLLQKNQLVCEQIVQHALDFYRIERSELEEHIRMRKESGQSPDRVSVSQALKHFVRDWATSGRIERDAAFPCIIQTLEILFPRMTRDRIQVVFPGAGVGRLGHEVAERGGFEVINNEWSIYQNLAYRFLSSQDHRNNITIYPFVDSWSHHKSNADMLRPISTPEVPLLHTDVLLVEGDFTTIFNKNPQRDSKLYRLFHQDKALPSEADKFDGSEYFDVVTTHFFIDTARNIMSYFDTIHKILKSGGYWINFGPLLYGTGPWVQLSLDEIVAVVESIGFEFIQMDGMGIAGEMQNVCGEASMPGKGIREKEAIYGFDERALTKNAYAAQFWVVRKK